MCNWEDAMDPMDFSIIPVGSMLATESMKEVLNILLLLIYDIDDELYKCL